MRDINPSNPQNWKLVCSACGMEWFSDEVISLTEGHFQTEHPDLEKPNFNIVWVGIGPKPKSGYINRKSKGPRRKKKR